MPKYRIEKVDEEPFEVRWEELMGWFLVPRLGEKLSWGMYDMPSGKCDHYYDMEVTGRAEVHGIEGVELIAREASYSAKTEKLNRKMVQATKVLCLVMHVMKQRSLCHFQYLLLISLLCSLQR